MNIATTLIPVASAAVDTVVHGISDIAQAGRSFARLLQDSDSAAPASSEGTAPGEIEWGFEASQWGEMVRGDALRQRFETLRESVHRQLVQRFAAEGIDLSEPVILASDSLGRLLEDGNHLDRGAVEELLQADPALRSCVQELLRQGGMLWESGPERGDGGQPRLVVGEKELFFQVV